MSHEKCNSAIKRSSCPITMALDIVGDKWSLLILRDLMFTEKRTYGEFQASEERIATNILAARLSSLEAAGIIYKSPDPANGRRIIHRLTEKGIDLLPVIVELNHWMLKWGRGAMPCSESLKASGQSKAQIIAKHMKELRKEHLAAATNN